MGQTTYCWHKRFELQCSKLSAHLANKALTDKGWHVRMHGEELIGIEWHDLENLLAKEQASTRLTGEEWEQRSHHVHHFLIFFSVLGETFWITEYLCFNGQNLVQVSMDLISKYKDYYTKITIYIITNK